MTTLVVGTNSYVSVDEATDYFSLSLNADDWTAASATEKAAALVTAARAIDRQPLKGRKYDWWTPQEMAFPRYVEAYLQNSSLANILAVPQEVKDAQCEEALTLLQHGNDTRVDLARLGLGSSTIDGATETYRDEVGKGLLSSVAKELLRPWLVSVVEIR